MDILIRYAINNVMSYKSYDHTCNNTFRVDVTSLKTSISKMRFLLKKMITLKAIKSHFKGSYYKQNLTLVVISYEIYETGRRLVS